MSLSVHKQVNTYSVYTKQSLQCHIGLVPRHYSHLFNVTLSLSECNIKELGIGPWGPLMELCNDKPLMFLPSFSPQKGRILLMRKMLICSLIQAASQGGRPSALSTPPSCLKHLGESMCLHIMTYTEFVKESPSPSFPKPYN